MKKISFLLVTVVALASGLAACSSSSNSKSSESSSSSTKTSKTAELKQQATDDADTVLDYMYKGHGDMEDVAELKNSEVQDYLEDQMVTKQTNDMGGQSAVDTFGLEVDGSVYTGKEIISNYAKAYIAQLSKIGDYKIKSVTVNKSTAKVKAEIKPISATSEAHPIGEARTEAFGGLDNDEIVRRSQNKDDKAILKLINLKLYSVYYDDMAKVAPKVTKAETIEFTLNRDGDKFTISKDSIKQLAVQGRSTKYAPSDASDSSSDVTSDSDSAVTQ